MSTIKLNELAESELSLTDLIAKADTNGLMTRTNIEKLANYIGAIGSSGMKGAIESTSPAPTEDGLYPCTESGTYTNFGGEVVDISGQVVFISVSETQTVFTLVEIPLNIVLDSVPTESSTNAVESGGLYDSLIKKGSSVYFQSNTGFPNIDSINNILTLKAGTTIFSGGVGYLINGDGGTPSTSKTIDFSATSNGYITFNLLTQSFTVRDKSVLIGLDKDEVIILVYATSINPFFSMNGVYTIDEFYSQQSGNLGLIYNANTPPNFDSANREFTVFSSSRLMCGRNTHILVGNDGSNSNFVLDLDGTPTGSIYYNILTKNYYTKSHSNTVALKSEEIFLATYGDYGADYISMAGSYTINGLSKTTNGNVALIYNSTKLPNFDTSNQSFTIAGASRVMTGKETIILTVSDLVLDLSGTPTGSIYFNTISETFNKRPHSLTTSLNDYDVFIATYGGYGADYVSMVGDYSVNNVYGSLAGSLALIYNSLYYPNFDSVNQKFTIPASSRLMVNSKTILLSNSQIDVILTNSKGSIYYDLNSNTFFERSYTLTTNLTNNQIFIATYGGYGADYVSMAGSYTVNNSTFQIGRSISKIINPNYEVQSLPVGVNYWSDFVAINDELWIFKESSDETHTVSDGTIQILDLSDYSLQKTITHNLGHCNTVSYNSEDDILMIGNLPGSVAYPSALYLLYDFSTLRANTTINFNTIDKTIIDLKGSGARSTVFVSNCAGTWGDNNNGKRDIVYVSSVQNRRWGKIILGKGSNDLGLGVFTSTTSNKFNGSFKILKYSEFILNDSDGVEVTQGIDYYKGSVVTSNGHNGLLGAIWNFQDNGKISRDRIESKFYDNSGDELDYWTEGLTIYNDEFLHGIIDLTSSLYKIVKYKI